MKATGIVVEYNPFHNGHQYHTEEAKQTTQADVIIGVMSGNFLQRGEPAFVDKWTRAQMALHHGVDLLFELPYPFATATAPLFAKGAITLLDAARCHAFCFGSEAGNIEPFQNTLSMLTLEKDAYEQTIQQSMLKGISYPAALNVAYQEIVQKSTAAKEELLDLTTPNNILGFHYMEAAQAIHSTMEASTIGRLAAHYYDEAVKGNSIASATGIRKSYFENSTLSSITEFIPPMTAQLLKEWLQTNRHVGSWSRFYPLLRFTILREGPERLREIADVTEGIENSLFKAAKEAETFEAFMGIVKTRRYTWTRIQRMLTHIFTGFTLQQRATMTEPAYLRLLGMTTVGRAYLQTNKKQFKLPLVSRAAGFSHPAHIFDLHATDLYRLGIQAHGPSIPLLPDFQRRPLLIEK